MSNDPAKPVDDNVVKLSEAFANPKHIAAHKKPVAEGNATGSDRAAVPPVHEKRGLDDPPFTVLGITEDGGYAVADAMQRIIFVRAKEVQRLFLKSICSPHTDWLVDNFPSLTGKGKHSVDSDAVENFFFNECSRKGFFDLRKSIRGRGPWPGRDGVLIYHVGDKVFIDGVAHAPGEIDGSFYPAKSPSPHPYAIVVTANELRELFEMFKRWNWKDALAAQFLLGWIAVGFLGAWLKVRPVIFITGARGTGKSTLIALLKDIFKDMIVVSADATAMGAAQKLGHDSIPVALDELEADGDSRRVDELLKLITLSATGAERLRGSADSSGVKESLARSAIIAAAINVPALQPAAQSRTAILELDEIKVAGRGVHWDSAWTGEVQRKVMRRLQDHVKYWEATAAIYRQAVIRRGLDDRAADVYATLFTGAHVLMHDGVVSEEAANALMAKFEPTALSVQEDNVRNEEHALQHLLTQSIPLDGPPPRRPTAEVIARAAGFVSGADENEARHLLARYGMRIELKRGSDLAETLELSKFIIANSHTETGKLFANTSWMARPGTTGGWRSAFRKLPGASAGDQTYYFARVTARATVLPLSTVLPLASLLAADAPEKFSEPELWNH